MSNLRQDLSASRIVSRDFISGAADGIDPEAQIHVVCHDYASAHIVQSLRDRRALGRAVRGRRDALDTVRHTRRQLNAKLNRGLAIGCIFGFVAATVFYALSSPVWAPLMVRMVQP